MFVHISYYFLKEFSDRALQGGMGHCVIREFPVHEAVQEGSGKPLCGGLALEIQVEKRQTDIISGSSSRSWDWRKNASQISLLPFLEDDA